MNSPVSRVVASVALASVLSACSGDIFLSAPAKLNKAFPPIAEVRVSEESMRGLLKGDAAGLADFEQRYAARMVLRALNCAQGVTVGRFDSIDKVKTYAVNPTCLAEQDSALLDYLGIRQIGLRLKQPALRPLRALGAAATVPGGGTGDLYNAFAASAAGVAVVSGLRGDVMSIELPGGKKIASLRGTSGMLQNVRVSPNGRVAALYLTNNSVAFVDTESGSQLWQTSAIKQFYAFLPEANAGLAADAKTGALTLVDFTTGTVEAHPVGLSRPSWALNVSSTPSRVLVGSGSTVTLLEHTRAESLDAVSVKEFQLRQNNGYAPAPLLMQDGKSAVFLNGARELTRLDLENGKESSWATADYFVNRSAKLSETSLLLETADRSNGGSTTVVFDIVDGTVAPVTSTASYGSFNELNGRTGYFRRTGADLAIGDTVTTGAPVALASVLETYNLARQMARLQQASMEGATRAEAVNAMTPAPAFSFAFEDGGSKAVRAAPAAATGVDAGMSMMAKNSRIEAVGVYQGANATGNGARKIGNVTVRVRRGKPVILVLSSYEPVRWNVMPEAGAHVLGVLVSGYYQSEVTGVGRARVIMAGNKYAYEPGTEGSRALREQTMLYIRKDIDSFQGKYEGSAFTVGE